MSLPESKCPTCGYAMDCATNLENNRAPIAGDFSLCFGCAELLCFDDGLRLVVCDLNGSLVLTPEQHTLIERAQRLIRKRRVVS